MCKETLTHISAKIFLYVPISFLYFSIITLCPVLAEAYQKQLLFLWNVFILLNIMKDLWYLLFIMYMFCILLLFFACINLNADEHLLSENLGHNITSVCKLLRFILLFMASYKNIQYIDSSNCLSLHLVHKNSIYFLHGDILRC